MFLLIFLSIFIFYPSLSYATNQEIIILYSGSTLGELRPCGCAAEGDQGGMARRGTFFKQEKNNNKNIIILDGGDNLSPPNEQAALKDKAIMEGMLEMDYLAVTFGEKDFALGNNFINKYALPWLAANISFFETNKNQVRDFIIKEFPEENLKIGIIGLLDQDLFYFGKHTGVSISDPVEAVQKIIPVLKNKNIDLVVVLGHLKDSTAKKLAEIKGIDIIINGHLEDLGPKKDTEKGISKIITSVYESGKAMGKLKITIKDKLIVDYKNEFIILDKKFTDDEKQAAIYQGYNDQVAEIFKEALTKKTTSEKSIYQGEKVCRKCHQKESEIWTKSKHAQAFASLENVNKHYDPECIVCHVTGFKKDGFLSDMLTPDLTNVQCEMCHGQGSEHFLALEKPYGKKAKENCINCHSKKNSPVFNLDLYWERIKH